MNKKRKLTFNECIARVSNVKAFSDKVSKEVYRQDPDVLLLENKVPYRDRRVHGGKVKSVTRMDLKAHFGISDVVFAEFIKSSPKLLPKTKTKEGLYGHLAYDEREVKRFIEYFKVFLSNNPWHKRTFIKNSVGGFRLVPAMRDELVKE